MKVRMLFSVLVLTLLPVLAHGQCIIQAYPSYSESSSISLVPESDGALHFVKDVMVEGSADMQMVSGQYPCPQSQIDAFNSAKPYIQHTPSVTNQIGNVGGTTTGPGFCGVCYNQYDVTVDAGPLTPNQTQTWDAVEGGEIVCGSVGIILYVSLNLGYEEAITYSANKTSIGGPGQPPAPPPWPVYSFCNDASSPPDYNPNVATILPPPNVPVYYPFFAALVICSRAKNAAVGTPWVCPTVSLPYSVRGHYDPTDRQYCTNKDKGIGNDKITYWP